MLPNAMPKDDRPDNTTNRERSASTVPWEQSGFMPIESSESEEEQLPEKQATEEAPVEKPHRPQGSGTPTKPRERGSLLGNKSPAMLFYCQEHRNKERGDELRRKRSKLRRKIARLQVQKKLLEQQGSESSDDEDWRNLTPIEMYQLELDEERDALLATESDAGKGSSPRV